MFETDVYGISVILTKGGGLIRSKLKEGCDPEDKEYMAAVDGIEALILAHACAGIDITTAAYKEGIAVAVNEIDIKF